MPAVLGVERIADMIVRPEASDLLRCVGHESGFNAEIEEFTLIDQSPAVGKTVRASEEQQELMIVAIRRGNDETIFNPNGDERLCVNDIVVLMGSEAAIEHFYKNCVAPIVQEEVFA